MADENDLKKAANPPEENILNPEVAASPGEGEASSEEALLSDSDSPGGVKKEFAVVHEEDASEEDAEAAMMALLEDLPNEQAGAAPEDINFGAAKVSPAQFQHLSQSGEKSTPRNIDLLMDVNLPVSIELGRTKMAIADILALGPGSVVELNKLAGEPVDVMVNYKAVAKGEVVVIDENFGVRITQLMTPEERLRSIADER
jgi:flagellar motor switch protein FliN/FliY